MLGHSLIRSGMAEVVVACGVENMTRLRIGSDSIACRTATASPWRAATSSTRVRQPVRGRGADGREIPGDPAGRRRFRPRIAGAGRPRGGGGAIRCPDHSARIPVFDENGKRTGATRVFDRDEIPRDTSLAALAGLKPVARADGIHTAGTSSQIADGAAAVLLMSATKAESLGLEPMARVVDTALVGCDPVLMLEGRFPPPESFSTAPACPSRTSMSSRSTRHLPR